jgi:acetyl-CoA carboxylase carboxyl transferase subunit alpha
VGNEIWLDFERPVVELERKIDELRSLARGERLEVSDEIVHLEKKAERLKREIYSKLNRWQRVQLARHPARPFTLDFIGYMTSSFIELHGDRLFGEDKAIVGGLGTIDGKRLLIIGHQKGRTTKEKLERNFGMPHPEGYRKALRLMQLAAKFGKPVVNLIDTPGAYPGKGAEERGQSGAIARNLREMALLPVPIIVIVTGEGGSGGALAMGVGDRILMLEQAIYSVISPEGCASILWRDSSKAPQAAEALKLTAQDLAEHGVIDEIIPEPIGGAHRDPEQASQYVKEALLRHLAELEGVPSEKLIEQRIEKYARMGVFDGGSG